MAVKDAIGKPIVAIWTAGRQLEPGAWRTLHDAGIPLFTQTGAAFRALERVRWYAEFLAGRADPEAADFGPHLGQAPQDGTPRDEIARFGVRMPRAQLATSAEEAGLTAVSFGGPVAMKIASPDIPHKTEAGGVRLGVAGGDAARAAFEEVVAHGRAYAPAARIDGVEIQEMVPEGVEILLGVSTDDQLGPILTVGLGGVLTEVLRDVAQRPVPVSRAEARRMLAELRSGWVLDGFRGRPPPMSTRSSTRCSGCPLSPTPGATAGRRST